MATYTNREALLAAHRSGTGSGLRNFQNAVCQALPLHHVNIQLSDFTSADFTGADLSHADFRGCTLTSCNFTNCDLTDAILDDCKGLASCTWTGAKLIETRVRGTDFRAGLVIAAPDVSKCWR